MTNMPGVETLSTAESYGKPEVAGFDGGTRYAELPKMCSPVNTRAW